MKYINYLVSWIQEQVKMANAKGVIVGISGGIDSALVSALAKKAFPNDSLGVIMPIGKMEQHFSDAIELAQCINIKHITVDLTNAYEEVAKVSQVSKKLAQGNIKPRLRMTTLYALAQENNYLVLGTDNAAEWILGYFTKYGDGGVDLLPIVHLTKGEVRELSQKLGIPKKIILKKPTADLWDGQSDEDELGFSYDQVDKYLKGIKISNDIKCKIEKQIKSTEHKRKALPCPKKATEI